MLTHDSTGGVSGQRRVLRERRPTILVLVVAAVALAGCAPRRPEAPEPPPPAEAHPAAIPGGTEPYDVVAGSGGVTLYVRRAGPLARLGHNHVITSSQATGTAWLGREPAQSGFELRVPVASFLVDDPAARAAAGADFPGEVPAQAREATYRNLLRPEVLDAARFPEIVVRSERLSGTWDRPVATSDVTLKGVTRRIDVPLEIQRSAGRLEASGSFRIRQTDFGLAPFSVAGGAIQVADEIEIAFEVVARRR